jgi:hypothetical protein
MTRLCPQPPALKRSGASLVVAKWPLRCAAISWHEAVDERSLRKGGSDPLSLESCAEYRDVHSEAQPEDRQGGYPVPKRCNPDADVGIDMLQESLRLCVGDRCKSRWGEAWETAGVAERSDEGSHSADGSKARYHEEDLLAYIPPHISSVLKSNGEDAKVVQELLRHSTARMTLDTYTQALSPQKRAAQSKVVSMIRPKGACTVDFRINPRKRLKGIGVPDGL